MAPKKRALGIITEDPAATMPIGSVVNVAPVLITYPANHTAAWLQDWESFEGVLLGIMFGDSNHQCLDGSAVLIAPGIALCATHVVKPRIADIMEGRQEIICVGIASGGLRFWRVRHVTLVPSSDLSILGLELASEFRPGQTLHQAMITTRLPSVGERLALFGFRAGQPSFDRDDSAQEPVTANMLACTGQVTAQYPTGRDRVMMPWPCVEVSCPAWGGMSGGPVFDDAGKLVGLVSSSLSTDDDRGPSFVSLTWPALTAEFLGGWPTPLFRERSRLVDLDPRLCSIDDRYALSYRVDPETGRTRTDYRIWERSAPRNASETEP